MMALFGEEIVNDHDDEVDVDIEEEVVVVEDGSEVGEYDAQRDALGGKHEQQPQQHQRHQKLQQQEVQAQSSLCPIRIEPISGATLYELEQKRVENARQRGVLSTGCKEVDEQVLLGGGFERGVVVGLSSEDIDFGISLSIQTLARSLVCNSRERAAVITTLPASALLGPLRSAATAQIIKKNAGHDGISTLSRQELHAELRSCLERVSISRVFDIVGLWQVLDELEASSRIGSRRGDERKEEDKMKEAGIGVGASNIRTASEKDNDVIATSLPSLRPEVPRMEIADSEDEDEDEALSSPEPSNKVTEEGPKEHQTLPPDQHYQAQEPEQQRVPTDVMAANSGMPDMILVTHFSTLLSELFTQSGHDRAATHTTLQLLSSHLRYLARSSGSVVVLLNTTTSYVSPTGPVNPGDTTALERLQDAPPVETTPQQRPSSNKPIDPTLRSIFNPAPMSDGTNAGASAAGNMLSRKNKPTFGLTFTQFLDVHLLCTRIPRTKDDAEHIYAAASRNENGTYSSEELKARFSSRYCWIVEVLLDELGVWVGSPTAGSGHDEGMKMRRENREQRWGAVQVRAIDGVVEDALGGVDGAEQRRLAELTGQGPFRLAAGFGGRRV